MCRRSRCPGSHLNSNVTLNDELASSTAPCGQALSSTLKASGLQTSTLKAGGLQTYSKIGDFGYRPRDSGQQAGST